METRIKKFIGSTKSKMKFNAFFAAIIMIVPVIILSASTPISQGDNQKNDKLKDRKLEILEKLESGKKVTPEEIRSIYGDFSGDDFITGPFYKYGWQNEDKDICDMDFSNMREELSKSFGELKKEIESFRNSEEFLNMQEELKKWSDEFKKEIENMKQDIFRPKEGTTDKEL